MRSSRVILPYRSELSQILSRRDTDYPVPVFGFTWRPIDLANHAIRLTLRGRCNHAQRAEAVDDAAGNIIGRGRKGDTILGNRAVAQQIAAQESLPHGLRNIEYDIGNSLGQRIDVREAEHMLPNECGHPIHQLELSAAIRR